MAISETKGKVRAIPCEGRPAIY